jgi:chromosome segregation ATPase
MITLKATYDKLQGTFNTLQESFNALKAENDTLKTDKAALEAKVQELTESQGSVDKAALAQANTDLEAAHKLLSDMTAQVETMKAQSKSASVKALEITQAQGVPAGTVKIEAGEAKPNVLDEAAKLPSKSISDYVAKNMHAISEALKEKASK